MKKILDWIKSPSSDFALFIILLVLANFVGHTAFVRFDLTKQKSYSLSKPSKQLVKNLEEPLSIKVFFDDGLPSPYNSYAQYTKDLLEEYEGAANKNFSVSYMDMSKEANQKLALDYGLGQIQMQEIKNNEIGFKQVYMGLVISYGDKIEKIDGITSTDGLEYKITSKISDMISAYDVLSGLGKGNKINLTLYLSSEFKNESLRIAGIDQVEDYVKETYKTVNKQNLDRIDFNIVNPSSEQAFELAEKYGIQGFYLPTKNGGQELAVIGLVISYNDNFRVLPLSLERGFFGYAVAGLDELADGITSGLQSLLSKATTIGYIVGHNEHGLYDERDAANFNTMVTTNGNYVLKQIDLTEGPIPANITTLILDGPQSILYDEELYKIDQFIMRGGNVMFFVDGTMGRMGQNQQPVYGPTLTNIDRLLNAYGVFVNKNMVMDKNCHVQGNQSYGKLDFHWVPSIQNKDLAKNHPITNNLGYVYMLQNASLDLIDEAISDDVKVTVLAKSSPEAWTMEDNITLNPMMLYPPEKSELKQYDLVLLLEGKFKSAFDEAVAPVIYDENGNVVDVDTTEDSLKAATHISSSKLPGKIFVVGSSQITTYQLLDGGINEPIANFLMNTIDYMSGNEELCEMRTKGLSLNVLSIKSQKLANFFKYFNEFGLVILVALAGLIVWRLRTKRRAEIRKRYNPNDDREIVKEKKKEETKGGNE